MATTPVEHTPLMFPCTKFVLWRNLRPLATSISCETIPVRLPDELGLVGTHQSQSVGLGILPRITQNVAILHPRAHHRKLVMIRRSPIECEDIWVIQALPQEYFFAKPL